MPQPYQPPTGRLNSRRRSFEEVVRDIRYTVFSVIRLRPAANGTHDCSALGSGFFVSPTIFLTCHHVVNPVANPHRDGDCYRLVAVTDTRGMGVAHQIANVAVGQTLHLFPTCDLALFQLANATPQPFVALDYGDQMVGKEIGVAGYPLAALAPNPNGDLLYNGLIFRVARGVMTSTYSTNINQDQNVVLPEVPVLEVNFLFVPGNSGGPVFAAETGRVMAFVHGYTTMKIREKVEQVTMINPLPQGVAGTYIENLNALYSLAIRMEKVRSHLEALGVTL